MNATMRGIPLTTAQDCRRSNVLTMPDDGRPTHAGAGFRISPFTPGIHRPPSVVRPLTLDPIPPFGAHHARREGSVMEGKAQFFFPILATGIVVFVVSCVVTFSNIGLRADFVYRWLSAFSIGWPVASGNGRIAFPFRRRATTGDVPSLVDE